MVHQKACIGVPLGCLAQFDLGCFFPIQIIKISQKSKLPLLKKGGWGILLINFPLLLEQTLMV